MTEPTDNNVGVLDQDKVRTIRDQNEYMLREASFMTEIYGREGTEKISLAGELLDIVYDTKLPEHFEVVDTTSTTNAKVESKYRAILSVPELQTIQIIPGYMTREYRITETFDENTLKRAPWVNDIHAWMKVLNISNTLAAIQRNEVNPIEVPGTIASIAEDLYSFTTESDKKSFLRTSKQFSDQERFPETVLRESGTEGVNSSRHVSLGEMKYILQAMKRAFAKSSS